MNNTLERIEYLKTTIDEQHEWGNYKVANLFQMELDALLRKENKEIGA